METCYRKKVRLLTAIKIQTPVCIFLLPPEKDPKFPHKTLPALSRVLSLRRRLSGHRCVIQNSFEYFCPSGAAFRGFGHVMQNSFGYFCPSGAGFRVSGTSCKTISSVFFRRSGFRDLRSMTASQFRVFLSLQAPFGAQVCHTKQFRIFLSLRSRLSGLRACNTKQFRVFLSLRSRLFISFRPSKQIINIYKKKALNRQNRGTG